MFLKVSRQAEASLLDTFRGFMGNFLTVVFFISLLAFLSITSGTCPQILLLWLTRIDSSLQCVDKWDIIMPRYVSKQAMVIPCAGCGVGVMVFTVGGMWAGDKEGVNRNLTLSKKHFPVVSESRHHSWSPPQHSGHWLEHPLGLWEARVQSPTESHQRRKNWEVCASWLGTWH